MMHTARGKYLLLLLEWLYSPCGSWTLFNFLMYSQLVGLPGRVISSSQGPHDHPSTGSKVDRKGRHITSRLFPHKIRNTAENTSIYRKWWLYFHLHGSGHSQLQDSEVTAVLNTAVNNCEKLSTAITILTSCKAEKVKLSLCLTN
jgi:hypothetical protein